jgi:hypothetical protein
MVSRRNHGLRIKVGSAKHSVGQQARESRRPRLGSHDESGEDSRGVQHRQSGRTRQRSPVDLALGFKEEQGLESRRVQPSHSGEPNRSPGDSALVLRRNQVRVQGRFAVDSQEEPGKGVQ